MACKMAAPDSPAAETVQVVEEAALSRDAIFSAQDIRLERVEVPEWGGALYIRVITGGERDEFEATLHDARGKLKRDNIRARVVALAACSKDGAPLFVEPGDVDRLAGKSAAVLDRVFTAAMKLNGMLKEEVDSLAGE